MEVDEEQLVELDLHVVDGLVAAGLERRQDGIREVLPRGDRLKQLGARLVHALRACDAVGLDFAGSGPCAGRARRVVESPIKRVQLNLLLEAIPLRLALDTCAFQQQLARHGTLPLRDRNTWTRRGTLPRRRCELISRAAAGPPLSASKHSIRRAGSAAGGTPRRGTRRACRPLRRP